MTEFKETPTAAAIVFPTLCLHWILPPLSNSWVINTIWLHIALSRTPNIDCSWVGAVPNVYTVLPQLGASRQNPQALNPDPKKLETFNLPQQQHKILVKPGDFLHHLCPYCAIWEFPSLGGPSISLRMI